MEKCKSGVEKGRPGIVNSCLRCGEELSYLEFPADNIDLRKFALIIELPLFLFNL